MVSTPILVAIIFLIIAGLGYYGYTTNQYQIKPLIQQYVPSSITQRFSTGDVMTLNLQPLANSHTTTFGSTTPITNSIPNSTSQPIQTSEPVNTTQSSIINVTKGQSFGQTSQFKEVLPTDTYQLGNPVGISGTIQMVIPNSCINTNGQVTCQYVQPPLFNYRLLITCKIPENTNCVMDDVSSYGTTDGSGGFEYNPPYGWIPNTNINTGTYLVTIQASSLVKDSKGEQYVITQQRMINLVR